MSAGRITAKGVWIYQTTKPSKIMATMAVSNTDIADARRIAACWNACEGISTDLLEAAPYKDSASFMADLKVDAQRDKLLAALEYAVNQVPELATVPGINAAIAKATEVHP